MKNKFVLIENFTWLLHQLDTLPGNRTTGGRLDLQGGPRRRYRYEKHFEELKKYNVIPAGNETIYFNLTDTPINVDKWIVDHPYFADDELKERYPKPKEEYTVMVTSRKSFENKTAPRYYVSCGCMDFLTKFKKELSSDKYGYTNDTGIDQFPDTGKIKQEAAICKHILCVLVREYDNVLKAENGIIDRNASVSPAVLDALFKPENIQGLEPEEPEGYQEPWQPGGSEIVPPPTTPQPTPTPVKPPISKETPESFAKRKEMYDKQIRKTLKFLSNTLSNDAKIAYKDARAADPSKSFKQYKFSVKHFPQGHVIVFSNPDLNVFSGGKSKEIVPIFTRNGNNFRTGPQSPVIVYTKYFSKDELMNMIRQETKPLQQNQIDYLTKRLGKIKLSESLDIDYDTISSLLLEIY